LYKYAILTYFLSCSNKKNVCIIDELALAYVYHYVLPYVVDNGSNRPAIYPTVSGLQLELES